MVVLCELKRHRNILLWNLLLETTATSGQGNSRLLRRDNVTLISGPTASGKSAFAMTIARQKDGVIINADSMQVYDVLRVLTARPSEADESEITHVLYGHVDPGTAYSTGHWLRDVSAALADIDPDRHIIFVGGTGLYFKALLGGLSSMPDIPGEVRDRWRYRLREEGAPKLHRILRSSDPEMAMSLNPADGQRIARALEVLETTGKSLSFWQGRVEAPIVDSDKADCHFILPERSELHARIETRFDRMIEMGALDEVLALKKRRIDAEMPAQKAIGVPQLSDFIDGKISQTQAIELSKTATRQYAKRQMTWFRNQFDARWQTITS